MLAVEAAEEPTETGLLVVAALAAIAFVVGQATKRFVSEVIVFIAIGIVVGPEVLEIIDSRDLVTLEPVISLALGAIVFGIGERLELPALKEIRHTLTPISVLENLASFGLPFIGVVVVTGDVSLAFLLAAIALSTSPTTLVAVINERRARGGFTDHLLASTALNNVTSALVYGIGLPIVLAAQSTSGATQGALAFAQLIVASVLIGGAGGWVLRRWMDSVHRAGERLLFVLLVLVGVVAVSRAIGAPVVISTLLMGAYVANDNRDTSSLFGALRILEAPIFLVFFLVAGAGVHFQELTTVGAAGAAFVVGRLVGKIAGGWIGADLTRSGRRSGWAAWIGLGLQPFAGMAIGLAAFTLERASEAGLADLGSDVSAIVLGSVVVFELLGPVAVGRALDQTGESGRDEVETADTDQPRLIHHILVPVSSPEMARRKGSQIVDLAASAGAVLTGLHIIPPGSRIDPNVGDPALSYIRQIAASRGVQFEPVVRESDSVVDAIIEEARRAAVDLVVLGEPVPSVLDAGGGRRIIHEVASRVEAGVRVLVVPTTFDERPRPTEARRTRTRPAT
ncbi:MAG: universal stress protein [Nitriliruptorales bacterium]|nr:universal stress protein [Nitriliruptorales bacterium]